MEQQGRWNQAQALFTATTSFLHERHVASPIRVENVKEQRKSGEGMATFARDAALYNEE